MPYITIHIISLASGHKHLQHLKQNSISNIIYCILAHTTCRIFTCVIIMGRYYQSYFCLIICKPISCKQVLHQNLLQWRTPALSSQFTGFLTVTCPPLLVTETTGTFRDKLHKKTLSSLFNSNWRSHWRWNSCVLFGYKIKSHVIWQNDTHNDNT